MNFDRYRTKNHKNTQIFARSFFIPPKTQAKSSEKWNSQSFPIVTDASFYYSGDVTSSGGGETRSPLAPPGSASSPRGSACVKTEVSPKDIFLMWKTQLNAGKTQLRRKSGNSFSNLLAGISKITQMQKKLTRELNRRARAAKIIYLKKNNFPIFIFIFNYYFLVF